MTSSYQPRNGPGYLFDLIDKHVSIGNASLQEHYQKAASTRALLKAMGCSPAEKKPTQSPPRDKKPKGYRPSLVARLAYEWARSNGKTYAEASDRFFVSTDAIHSFRQYNKLKPLKK